MSTIACCTLGCKVNQYDSQAMMEIFTRAGYEVVPFAAQADVYLINTCTVTGTGDHKSMQMIRRAARRNPSADLVVTGCMAQHAAESLRQLPGVRLVLGTQRRAQVLELLRQAQALHTQIVAVEPLTYAGYETLQVTASEGHTRATLKIQEGCDRHCTYCIIPTVRGPIRSRPLQDVRREAERLAQAGFEELVLTGIHLASYGRDFEDGTTLYAAMEAVHAVEGVRRIRLGSLEPRIVDETFAHAMAKLPKVCPHFTLALQSGSDTVLARMARRYNTTQYAQAAACLRAVFPQAALTCDVMVGFPGETEAEFAQTLAFVEQMAFSRIHVFPYSPREGTPAAQMADQVPQAIKAQRASTLIALGARLADAYAQSLLGTVQWVLMEEETAPGRAAGYTPQYVRVEAEGKQGQLLPVRLTKICTEGVMGETLWEEFSSAHR